MVDVGTDTGPVESLPLEVLEVKDNKLRLTLGGKHEFEVPLAVLPEGNISPKSLLLRINKAGDSVFSDGVLAERHKRLQELIN